MKTSRFVLACDLKVGDSIVVADRPYLITTVEKRGTEVTVRSGTWSLKVSPDDALEVQPVHVR